MSETFSVVHSTTSKDGAHVLDCSCSCGGPNVSVSNVHSARKSGEEVVIVLRNDSVSAAEDKADK